MKEMDEMFKQLFQDKPIAQESLSRMNVGIMDQILANPVDFQEKQLVAQRQKAGFIFLGSIIGLSISFFQINWFFGSWLGEGLSNIVVWLAANVPVLAWFQDRLDWFFDTLTILFNIKLGYQVLWGQYGFAIMGILFSWVLFEGVRDQLNRKALEENS